LLLNKKYVAADAFLTKLEILPFEGATIGRQLYHEAKLMQAVAEMKTTIQKALQFIADAKLWPQIWALENHMMLILTKDLKIG